MSTFSSVGVPRIIHQTWHSSIDTVTKEKGDPYSWIENNPQWEYKFWSDDALRNFIKNEFPELIEIYDSYPNAVQRADLARYCLLSHYGGIYADIDTTCIASLEPIAGDTRVILCEEPVAHAEPALLRGLTRLLFNGTMASPPEHPLWKELIRLCILMASNSHRDVLESTGPLLLSAAVEHWQEPQSISINSSHLFCPYNNTGNTDQTSPFGAYGHKRISVHHWQGSWFNKKQNSLWSRKIGRLRQLKYNLLKGLTYKAKNSRSKINRDLLNKPLLISEAPPQVAIFIPVKDGAEFITKNFALIQGLNYPKNRLRVIFGEGHSVDESSQIIENICRKYGSDFKQVVQLKITSGHNISRNKRWKPSVQRQRRGAIAQVRNEMLNRALQAEDDFVLWLDVDINHFSSEILNRLLSENEKVVVPNCVLDKGQASFDQNCFLEIGTPSRAEYYKHCQYGLFQPPANYWFRRHLHELRYLDRVPLHGVGGCILLVHADIHRAGITFPELPYKDLIETEAFGYLAREMGIKPIGLPGVEVFHVKS
ncbi:glycosyltransferase [Amphritea sp. HPY]|uniref:glycosyltransferase n=1 Tax=Amphritea sp. HPY TaxID=3421652 RepID=UPI003D7D3EB0